MPKWMNDREAVVRVGKGFRITIPEEVRPPDMKERAFVSITQSDRDPTLLLLRKVDIHR